MENINNIFKENPKDKLWDRLEEKLDTERSVKKLQIYKVASLAAMFVALIAAVGYFKHVLNDHNPDLFVSNEGFSAIATEVLEHDENGLFNMESLSRVNTAFKRREALANPPTLSGQYKAKDGELSLSISLQEFSYSLDFSFDDFPTFYLEKIEGQTLYFGSEIKKYIKLNIEPYGLKLIESDFLPEYKNIKFNRLQAI